MFDLVGLMYFLEYIQNWSTTVYGVNIIQCISVAHFSYKNYRANFMHKVVYFLARSLRYVLQPHYTGAKIQIGQNIGENLYFYDVNSMYPYFMLNPLPNQYRGSAKKCNLNTFFGFICVTLVKKPKNEFFCNFKHAIVFSEEIKLLIKLGHKFIFHYFLKFVPAKLFTKYVNHFYFFRL